jgi:hypothetical protein
MTPIVPLFFPADKTGCGCRIEILSAPNGSVSRTDAKPQQRS